MIKESASMLDDYIFVHNLTGNRVIFKDFSNERDRVYVLYQSLNNESENISTFDQFTNDYIPVKRI